MYAQQIIVPAVIEEYLKVWNDQIVLKQNPRNTEEFYEDLKSVKFLRRGVFFGDKPKFEQYKGRAFSLEEFKMVVERFSLVAIYPHFWPLNKKGVRSMSISEFLHDPKTGESEFLFYLDYEPQMGDWGLKDEHPFLTTLLIEYYRDYHKEQWKEDFWVNDESFVEFVSLAKMVMTFITAYKGQIDPGYFRSNLEDEFNLAETIAKAFEWWPRAFFVNYSIFCDAFTISRSLYQYLKHIDVWKTAEGGDNINWKELNIISKPKKKGRRR